MVSGCLPSVSTAFATQSETATGSVHPIAGTTSLFTRAIICLRFDSGIIIIEKKILDNILLGCIYKNANEERREYSVLHLQNVVISCSS